MNKYFQSAIKRFNEIKKSDYLINPISEMDSQIIIELGQIIKKAGLTDVCEILKTYKEYKDEDVMKSLLTWNIDNPKITKSLVETIKDKVEELKRPYPMLMVKNLMLNLANIHGVATYERLDGEELRFGILLNPTPEHAKQIPLYANYTLEWSLEENRNNCIEKLKSMFQEYGLDFFNID